ncbi:hypothetical protein OH77DRAFT_1439279 [Trametes cingulata]|nr:hypothetical protein OH77DRAFT_1439279 [Trametes cingulata]
MTPIPLYILDARSPELDAFVKEVAALWKMDGDLRKAGLEDAVGKLVHRVDLITASFGLTVLPVSTLRRLEACLEDLGMGDGKDPSDISEALEIHRLVLAKFRTSLKDLTKLPSLVDTEQFVFPYSELCPSFYPRSHSSNIDGTSNGEGEEEPIDMDTFEGPEPTTVSSDKSEGSATPRKPLPCPCHIKVEPGTLEVPAMDSNNLGDCLVRKAPKGVLKDLKNTFMLFEAPCSSCKNMAEIGQSASQVVCGLFNSRTIHLKNEKDLGGLPDCFIGGFDTFAKLFFLKGVIPFSFVR